AVVIDGPDLETILGVGTRHHTQEVSLLPARNPRGHEDLVRNPVQLVLDGAVTLSVRDARGGPDVLLVAVGLSGSRSEGRREPNSTCDSGGTNRRQNLLQDVPFQRFAGALALATSHS